MKIITFLFFLMLLMAASVLAQTPKLEQLAKWRAANYSDVRYKINITLERNAPLMHGEIEIRMNLTDEGAKNDLVLDWRTAQFANDKDKSHAEIIAVNAAKDNVLYQEKKEHLIIPKGLLKAGENIIKIQFASPIKASGASVTRYIDKEDGAEYIYSSFDSLKASTAFPVFDQPNLKARFSLSIDAPSKWKVVSNTKTNDLRIFGTVEDPNFKPHTITNFEETKPTSTYVFAFAAGDFAEFADTKTSVEMMEKKREPNESMLTMKGSTDTSDTVVTIDKVPPRIYVRKSQAEKFKQHADEVFRLNRVDRQSPTAKLDIVLLPDILNVNAEYDGLKFVRESAAFKP